MKKVIMLASAMALSLSALALPVNSVLRLAADGSVNCGEVVAMNGLSNYSLQLWLNSDKWTSGAKVLSLGSNVQLCLGAEGVLTFKVDSKSVNISDAALKAGQWAQLTLINNNGVGTVLVNGKALASVSLPALPAETGALTIGGGFEGRVDELRLYSGVLKSDFNYFINNTLNRWMPQTDILQAYYKFDQTGCPNIVEQTAVWKNNTTDVNNHGVASTTGVSRETLTDNPVMKYRINSAYTANERFFDRGIVAEQYLVSNDIVNLGITSFSDGHLEYTTPNDHAVNNGVKHLESFEGKSNVASFDGSASLTVPAFNWNPTKIDYCFEMSLFIDEWVDGAVLMAKASADGSNGIMLTTETINTTNTSGAPVSYKAVVMTVNGKRYAITDKVATGKWVHIGVTPNAAPTQGFESFYFYVDGATMTARKSVCASEVMQIPAGAESADLVIGKGFKGKMKNVCVWNSQFDGNGFRNHMSALPMPGIGKVVTAEVIWRTVAAYTFENPDNLGFDSYSQDNWLAIMRSAFKGYDGYEMRISVKSHNGWETTISNAERRRKFAADLAVLSAPYDGVELDLEWMYGTQTNLGLLAEEIRKVLPAGKSLVISCHNVAYGFPKDKMSNCDGFTFQQYGPQKVHFGFNHFKGMIDTFVNYGFPSEKILGSYATTTSKGHQNGAMVTDIKGVRDNFLNDYTPSDIDSDCRGIDGYNYYFTGPQQVFNRAKYIVDKNCGGIFYWDMGNDVPFTHKYNLAKWCSYALNSNVEPRITELTVKHNSGVTAPAATATAQQLTVMPEGDRLLLGAGGATILSAAVYTAAGEEVAAAQAVDCAIDVPALAPGLYIVQATLQDGTRLSAKFVKK